MTDQAQTEAASPVVAADDLAEPAAAIALPVAVNDPAAALDAWRDGHLRDTDVSRDTEAWNAIGDAIETIKRVLTRVQQKGI